MQFSRGFVAPIQIILLALWLTSSSRVDMRHFRCWASDTLPVTSPAAVLWNVSSLLHCGMHCRVSLPLVWCRNFGYSGSSQQCLLYLGSPRDVLQPADSAMGFRYFESCPDRASVGAIGTACTVNSSCLVANSECRYSTCLCQPGYHFSPCLGTCVTVCPDGYGEGYYEIKLKVIRNHDDLLITTLPVADCWQACRRRPQCRSFETGPGNYCALATYTKLDAPPADWIPSGAYNYYQRYCA